VGRRIILELILKKEGRRMCTEFFCLMMTIGELLWKRY
jgi:hypothetical protein